MFDPVPAIEFADKMATHWRTLGNVPSQPLKDSWTQIAVECNRMIAAFGKPEGRQWRVLCPPTGSGKSESLKLYASELSRIFPAPIGHPGVLIVTRLMKDAELLASDINKMTGRTVAGFTHSEHKLSAEEAAAFPVLACCHSAYQHGLSALTTGAAYTTSWPALTEWDGGDGRRKLIVVDEAISLVSESTLDLDSLRAVEGQIPQAIRDEFPQEVKAIATIREILERFHAAVKAEESNTETILHDGKRPIPHLSEINFESFQRAMKAHTDRGAAWGKRRSRDASRSLAEDNDAILRECAGFIDSWIIATKVGDSQRSIYSARLLTHSDGQGAVCLDATAKASPFNAIFPLATVIEPPQKVRTYENVRLHVTQDMPTGRGALTDWRQRGKYASALLADIEPRLSGRKVLLVCHKDVKPIFQDHAPPFADFQVAHWFGDVIGTNDYRDCDVCVLHGLPWRPGTLDALTYFAVAGVQPVEWLRNPELRQWHGYKDIRRSLKLGALCVDICQAINRINCRKVIDAAGNCPKTDIYLPLPRNADAAGEILGIIQTQMPGIKVCHWDLKVDGKIGAARSRYERLLVGMLRGWEPGKREAQLDVATQGKIPVESMKKILGKIRNPDSSLSIELRGLGVRYYVDRDGRSPKGYFEKVKDPQCPSDATASIAMN